MTFRTIYEIEAVTPDGIMTRRKYARNKKIAERIARETKHDHAECEVQLRMVSKEMHHWINDADVENA